ncbi:hypothetical protein [Deinococcus sonorensis]|uniref:Uncharacterized protein n=2 Tax=Deinococcus sonorensis TaxID=309891 RepID=A0AAU7U5C1_9DEIO
MMYVWIALATTAFIVGVSLVIIRFADPKGASEPSESSPVDLSQPGDWE